MEPWKQAGSMNGVLVDTGSRDLVLHSDRCVPCGSASNSAHVTGSKSQASATGTERIHQRSLGDGQEWMTRHCEEVYLWSGSKWCKMSEIMKGRGKCTNIMSVIHRVPRPGFEGVSKSRAGTAGLGPSSTVFGCCVAIRIRVPDSAHHDRHEEHEAGEMVLSSEVTNKERAFHELWNEVSSYSNLIQICPCPSSMCSLTSGLTYKALVKSVSCADIKLPNCPKFVVVDTGSTYLYIPHGSWRDNLSGQKHPPHEVTITIAGSKTPLNTDPAQATPASEISLVVPSTAIRKLPESVQLPADVWILGALSLNGRTLLLCPEMGQVFVTT